jgi:hypothetical protein
VVQKSNDALFLSRALSTWSSWISHVTAACPSVYVVGLASRVFMGLPVVSIWFNTPSSCFPFRMHPEVFLTGPGVEIREEYRLSSLDLSPHLNV